MSLWSHQIPVFEYNKGQYAENTTRSYLGLKKEEDLYFKPFRVFMGTTYNKFRRTKRNPALKALFYFKISFAFINHNKLKKNGYFVTLRYWIYNINDV
jgi:hypothetical protein